MDKLGTKKKLYAGLGDFARQKRMEQMRKKYGAAPPEMAADLEKQDATVDAASLPSVKSVTGPIQTADVAADADKMNADYEKTLADMNEDEEMQKWMAKQRG
jgi:hypothetical protein